MAAETSVDALAAGHVPELDTYQGRKINSVCNKALVEPYPAKKTKPCLRCSIRRIKCSTQGPSCWVLWLTKLLRSLKHGVSSPIFTKAKKKKLSMLYHQPNQNSNTIILHEKAAKHLRNKTLLDGFPNISNANRTYHGILMQMRKPFL